MLTQSGPLGLLALVVVLWPPGHAVTRLERATKALDPAVSATDGGWTLPGAPSSRRLRWLLGGALVIALGQVWPFPVALAAVGVVVTVGGAAVRGGRERASAREEQAAVEGLGILVAELRAGREPHDALATAGRHCGHPRVGALMTQLGRSLRLGHRSERRLDPDRSTWQVRLLAGVALSQRTGCALADVIGAVESDLVCRTQQRAELRATAAGHRATVALLAGLPILGLAMGSGIGAEPVRILTSTTIGGILLLTGVALELLGLAWSRRMGSRVLREG
ncbi:MAG: type II secretion system F family protein [Pseudonocardiales bacterium]|nr:type II secretion system F family protein [Pseudonocardiales bacterium]